MLHAARLTRPSTRGGKLNSLHHSLVSAARREGEASRRKLAVYAEQLNAARREADQAEYTRWQAQQLAPQLDVARRER